MDKRIRASVGFVSTLLTYFVFKQDLIPSVLVAVSLYLFLESYQLKTIAKAKLFIQRGENVIVVLPSIRFSDDQAPYSDLEGKPNLILEKEFKVAESMTETKQFAEASTSRTIKLEDHGLTAIVDTEDFSQMADIHNTKGRAELSEHYSQVSVESKTAETRKTETQTEVNVRNQETGTRLEVKDAEVQGETNKKQPIALKMAVFQMTVPGKPLKRKEMLIQTENIFSSQSTETNKVESKDAEIQNERKKVDLKISFYQTSVPGRTVNKRQMTTQTEHFVKNQWTDTHKIEVKDCEVQAWAAQDEQEVNTTQSLLRSFGKTEERKRSNSLEVIHDEFHQKEILLSELLYERVTSRTGQVNYVFKTHLETELNVARPFKYPPFFISLLNWTQKDLAKANFDLLKERFQDSERVVKIRTNDFNVVDFNSFIDDPEFQFLYFGVYTNLLSNSSILIIDSSVYSESLFMALRIKWIKLKDFSPIFLLHTGSNLDYSTQEFCESIKSCLGLETSIFKNKLAYEDRYLNVFHLEAGKTQSFNFIEEKILKFDLYQNYIRDEFDLSEFCKEHLKKTLKLILTADESCKIRALSRGEDYGFNVTVKYKHLLVSPESILKKEETAASLLKVSSISLKGLQLDSTFSFSPNLKHLKTKPLACLYLTLTELNFSDIFLPSKHSESFYEIFCKVSQTGLKDELFPQLSSWVTGTYLSDYILLIIDFAQVPDLHHSDLILKFFNVLKDYEKPLYVLHRTCESVPYSYSLGRMNELIESAWLADKVVIHEEITDNVKLNTDILESIRSQMKDNLFDPDTHFNLEETCKGAFEAAVEKLMLIQNSRKRELLIKAENEAFDDYLVVKSELESTWNAGIRESFQQSSLKNIVYVSPGQYHIDKNISSTIYSTLVPFIQDHVIKIGVFSNLPGEKLSHLYLSDLAFCFAQNKEDTLLIFPSSRRVLTSASNHLNTPEFNSVFLYKFIEKLSDCLIISIFYERDQIINSFDNFRGISSALASRPANKPILVMHHNDSEGQISEMSYFFSKAITEFDLKYCEWTRSNPSSDIKVIENINEGLYAFDPSKQIIHRLAVPTSELVWKWYNGVLYKIMHNAALKTNVKPLVVAAQEAFDATMKETILVADNENIIEPEAQVSNYMEESWKALSSFSFTVYAEILPLWTITSTI